MRDRTRAVTGVE